MKDGSNRGREKKREAGMNRRKTKGMENNGGRSR